MKGVVFKQLEKVEKRKKCFFFLLFIHIKQSYSNKYFHCIKKKNTLRKVFIPFPFHLNRDWAGETKFDKSDGALSSKSGITGSILLIHYYKTGTNFLPPTQIRVGTTLRYLIYLTENAAFDIPLFISY